MNSFSFESLFPGEKMGREAPALPFSFHIHQFLNLKKEEEGVEEAEVQEDKITTSQKEAEDEDKTGAKVSHILLYTANKFRFYAFPEKKSRGLSRNVHSNVSVSDLYISTIGPLIFLQQKRQTDHGNMAYRKHKCRN
jgi:hypothetical protein